MNRIGIAKLVNKNSLCRIRHKTKKPFDQKSNDFALDSILNDMRLKSLKKRESKTLKPDKIRRPSLPFRIGGRIGKKNFKS